MPRSSPSTICAARTPKVSQMRSSVRSVIGLPASICCQWRAEKPNPIMSSCVYPLALRNFLTRRPRIRKNCRSFTTSRFVGDGRHQHHEQISWEARIFLRLLLDVYWVGKSTDQPSQRNIQREGDTKQRFHGNGPALFDLLPMASREPEGDHVLLRVVTRLSQTADSHAQSVEEFGCVKHLQPFRRYTCKNTTSRIAGQAIKNGAIRTSE
jgi:hypothetical protein